MAAGVWSISREGVSDLQRYWHGRPSQFTVSELVAFHSTLPEDSATMRSTSDSVISLEGQLLCIVADSIRGLAAGLGGKKLKKDEMLSEAFSKKALQKKLEVEKERREVLEALRASKNVVTN